MSHHASDERLVQFLRKYSPPPPSPKGDVEGALMDQIEAEAPPTNVTAFPKIRYQGWVFGSAIAASVLLLFTSVRLLPPKSLSPQETAELETFLIENWEAVTTPAETETSWFIPEQP
ncbi:hypothetical protein PCC7418_1388 [Halothece sp. PCC 7418]|uniref:hypothetical protein n=1 Tax=Halothece sp. (strain PCC 7418) TaxID=65093 RepID=UPI0002A06ACF|nr:hypothetical protein [Halothece sp. PCC 7418]AFZ43584.1 hypothetical protein PCC7418_1388 [Halothece sp. PCC 7418]